MSEGTRLCVAPWYSVVARGFVPRLYLLDDSGWPIHHIDGRFVLPTYDQAVEAAQLLSISTMLRKIAGAAASYSGDRPESRP